MPKLDLSTERALHPADSGRGSSERREGRERPETVEMGHGHGQAQRLKPESEIEWREKCAVFVERVFIPILKDKNAKRNRLEMVSYDPSERSVGEVIVRKSEEHDVCFIFMFAHHKSRLHEFFLGSCANYVLHRSSKPVMLFKREEKTETQELE